MNTNTTVQHRNALIDVTLYVAVKGFRPLATTWQRWVWDNGTTNGVIIGSFRQVRTTLAAKAGDTPQRFTLTNWS